jgi:regulator of protease activity HflC (stomatin/prohibitin superfamily)
MKTDNEPLVPPMIKWIIGGFFVFIGLSILFSSFYIVGAGERGILVTLGNPSMTPYSEGLHFKFPLVQSVIILDVKTQKYEGDAAAASKDLQTVQTKLAINYHLIPENVPRLYKEIGLDYSLRIIQPMEQEVVKATTAQFTAEELITRREEVRDGIKQTLKERLVERGIVVKEVSIVNFDFSTSFNEAIEAKVTAEQQALAAKNKLEQVKFEAEQLVAKATAEAEALRLKKQQITPELVQLSQIEVQSKALDVQREAIAKWNGILPQVTGGATPFFNLNMEETK